MRLDVAVRCRRSPHDDVHVFSSNECISIGLSATLPECRDPARWTGERQHHEEQPAHRLGHAGHRHGRAGCGPLRCQRGQDRVRRRQSGDPRFRSVWSLVHLQAEQVFHRLAAQDEPRGVPSRTATTAGRASRLLATSTSRSSMPRSPPRASRSPGRDIVGHPDVTNDDIATLAMLSDHARHSWRAMVEPGRPVGNRIHAW